MTPTVPAPPPRRPRAHLAAALVPPGTVHPVPHRSLLLTVLLRALSAAAVVVLAVFVLFGGPSPLLGDGEWLPLAGRLGFVVALAATGHALLSRH